MPILYSAVSHEMNLLAHFASCDGNFSEILEQVLKKISFKNEKMTYYHGHYLFHYIAEDKHVYFCITDKSCQRSRAFLFLNEIKRQLTTKTKEELSSTLATEMRRYSEDYSTITIRKGELDELNSIAVDSSEVILGEKILYVKNPDKLSFTTITCVRKSPQRILISFQSFKLNIYIVTIILILLIAFYLLGPMSSCYLVVLILGIRYILK